MYYFKKYKEGLIIWFAMAQESSECENEDGWFGNWSVPVNILYLLEMQKIIERQIMAIPEEKHFEKTCLHV